MGRETQNLVLLFLGLAVGKTVLDGTFERYVKPSLGPYLLVSAAVLIALALYAIVGDIRAGGPRHTHSRSHTHSHGSDRVLWYLAVPLLVVLFLVPPTIRPDASGRSANQTIAGDNISAGGVHFTPIPAGAPELDMLELLQRALAGDQGGLSGRDITLSGYALTTGDQVSLARVVIVCCAADARTYRVDLLGAGAQQLRTASNDSWWRITGTVVDGSASKQRRYVPQLVVVDAEPIATPKNPYG